MLVVGAIKIADAIDNAARAYLASRREDKTVDWDSTPVFDWAARQRTRLEDEEKEKGIQALLLSVFIDFLFRAPVLGGLGGFLVLVVAVGSIHGSHSGTDATCAFPTVDSGISGWLTVAAAAVAVLVAMTSVFSFLQMIAQSRGPEPRGDAGQYVNRSQHKAKRKLLSPTVVALGTIVSLFLSFAALYAAVVAISGSGIVASPCRLDWIDMIYFSASVGATVGFGDISPTSPALRLITTTEIVVFFAVLALFLQALSVPTRRKPR